MKLRGIQKRLNLKKISRKRSRKFFGIQSFPQIHIPTHLEQDFKTLRSIMISFPKVTTTLYPGGSNQYINSFLSFYKRLGL
jgi:hypothetical protein